VFQQTIDIPICTNYAPLLTDLFHMLMGETFFKNKNRKLTQTFILIAANIVILVIGKISISRMAMDLFPST
jgi:hypothetical protein